MVESTKEILVRMEERQQTMYKTVEEIRKKLYGNGKEGLCGEMIEVKTTLRNTRFGIVIGFSIVAVLIGIFDIYKCFF